MLPFCQCFETARLPLFNSSLTPLLPLFSDSNFVVRSKKKGDLFELKCMLINFIIQAYHSIYHYKNTQIIFIFSV